MSHVLVGWLGDDRCRVANFELFSERRIHQRVMRHANLNIRVEIVEMMTISTKEKM
jgi:hypothetical protein